MMAGIGLAGHNFRFDPDRRVLWVALGKCVTEPLIWEVYTAIENFVAAEGQCSGIFDFSAVETLNLSADFVYKLAQRPPAIPIGRPRIIVAPRADIYGMGRMFQILRDYLNGELHVVRTIDEACAVLCIDPQSFPSSMVARHVPL